MNSQELAALASNTMTNYDGGDDLVNYSGDGDDLVDFGGIENTFATEIHKGRLMTITLVNTATLTRTAYVGGVGLVYVKGSEASGQAKTGAFNDTSAAAGLVGSASPTTIEKFQAWVQKNPTRFGGFKVKSTGATQIDQVITYARETPFSSTNEDAEDIFLASYADEDSYNDKIVTVPRPIQLDNRTLFTVPVIASSTLTLTFFGGAAIDLSKTLEKKYAKAKATITRVGVNNVKRQGVIRKNKLRGLLGK